MSTENPDCNPTPMIRVFVMRLEEQANNPEFLDKLADCLSEKGRQRVSGWGSNLNKLQTIAGELLATYSIRQFQDEPDLKIEMGFGENGKPHIENLDNLHFNISHSGHYVVCAVGKAELGIDVERLRKVNINIAERYFSASEINDLLKLDESERTDYFITLWTIKESFLKAIGKGLAQNLNSFTVLRSGDSYRLTGNHEAEKFQIATYHLEGGYRMAVCSTELILNPALEYVSLEMIA